MGSGNDANNELHAQCGEPFSPSRYSECYHTHRLQSLRWMVRQTMLRAMINLAGYVPLPSDAMVTPVTFRVRKLNLRGMLSDCDAKETEDRELSGEWVIGKDLWKKLQAEWKVASLSDKRFPERKDGQKRKDRVILYLHGGWWIQCRYFLLCG